jgi:hypothetical protein
MIVLPAAVAALAACGGAETAPPGRAEQARERVPVPRPVQRYVHETFHRLDRFCTRRRAGEARLDQTTTRFIGLYRRYPAERFGLKIDDEAGTMLSAILVLRHELARCSPRHAAAVDRILPADIRRALTPLRRGGVPRSQRRR